MASLIGSLLGKANMCFVDICHLFTWIFCYGMPSLSLIICLFWKNVKIKIIQKNKKERWGNVHELHKCTECVFHLFALVCTLKVRNTVLSYLKFTWQLHISQWSSRNCSMRVLWSGSLCPHTVLQGESDPRSYLCSAGVETLLFSIKRSSRHACSGVSVTGPMISI